jgi:predicted porin
MKQQLTILAAATLACIGSAQAQNSITFYGAMDAGLLNMSSTAAGYAAAAAGATTATKDTGKFTGIKDGGIGGSNIGLKGERDMGNGNKGYFQLQANVSLTDGKIGGWNSSATQGYGNFNQMALVGLSGKAGDLKVGRQVSPMYFAMVSTDARAGRYFGSTLTTLVGMNTATKAWSGAGNAIYGNVYNDNSVTYTSPKFADTTVSVQHIFGGTNGSNAAKSQDAVTAVYSKDGLRLSALYYSGNGNGNSAEATTAAGFTPTANTNRLTSLGALYSTGAWTMSAALFDGKIPSGAQVPAGTGIVAGSTHTTATALGLAYKLNPEITISGGYYDIKDKTNDGNKATQTAISVDYAMFKDTIVYLQTASTSNTGSNMNLSPIFGTPTPAGASNTATMLGMRYTF